MLIYPPGIGVVLPG
ncbi:hypothetical protein [Caballeronia arationis]